MPGGAEAGEAEEEAGAGSGSEAEEEALWERIEGVRHRLTRALNPAKLTPYLRQCRVIDEQDEEEVLSTYRFPSRVNRTGRLMDILRCRGKRGYEAFLEALEFYYPEHFTLLTGQEAAQRCSMILDEEGPEGLTQFLMTEVRRLREARKGQLQREQQLQARARALEEERAAQERRLRELQQVQERCQRLREDWEAGSLELLRLKDENYMVAMRLAQLSEEKNSAVLRSRDLQLAVDQLKLKVSRLEEECVLLRRARGPLPAAASATDEREKEPDDGPDLVSELRAENQRLTASLQELQEGLQQEVSRPGAPGSERILLDILEHDWREAQDSRQELCQKLHAVQGELQWAEELRDKYLQEMESLRLKHCTLQKDCDLYKHRMATVLAQLEEIEKERDQAIQSRDRVQLQYSQSLVEKDQYRKQVRGLEAERDELLTALTALEGAKALLDAQLQRATGGAGLSACASFHSLCSNHSSTWSLSEFPSPQGGPDASGESATTGGSEPHTSEEATDSEKEINRLSILPFPPSAGSILRRQREEDPAPPKRSFSSMSDITGSVTLKPWSPGLSSSSSSDSVWPLGKPDLLGSSLAIRVSGRSPPGGPESQSRGPDGLSLLADSWSGAMVRRVMSGPGSARVEAREPRAEAGLEGARLEGDLQQRTLTWNQVSTLPPFLLDSKACQSFHEALDAWVKGAGTEPFYIRANLSLPERADPHALCVKAQEILRLVDPAYKRRQEWFCARVDPLTLRDLDRGTVPNYQRAQQLLEVQEKNLPSGRHRAPRSNLKKRALDQLRLVKPKHTGDTPETLLLEPCVEPPQSLKPYSLVRPLLVPALRPVVLLPECLAPRLIRNLLDLPSSRLDFQVCPAESLSGEEQGASSAPGAPKARPATPGLGSRIRAIQESVGKKHCLLELGARGVRELVLSEIYPIVIHVEVTEKNVREVRGLLGRPGWRDSELLRQCRGSEHSLWGLPCSWAQVSAHAWTHGEELAKVVRGRILQEQARLVWVECGSGGLGGPGCSEA
ncbi:caspase recruitment domain-containing protein 10 isoform X1 [Sorex araneus]|uniref:caspase recruitment domain-containing protein 10 isoform X1 n=1 Tax=Sorex araneus TaxID=42254 RepID=UPI0024334FEC|nr:caspase recruitment domain-containing protein 10 isoform X1 [Sorex araneus]XP_054997098.1 caspase recruitment domain-containing protein 10 isoform X1 [Sorex araneus]XP_054997099.1 caspase recruitment domain-containing protein 10 isoform X1 [Sorex araneus]